MRPHLSLPTRMLPACCAHAHAPRALQSQHHVRAVQKSGARYVVMFAVSLRWTLTGKRYFSKRHS